ncbi:MAG TPA: DUF1302 domain-containing protein [Stenotrophobium sp.]|jgi:hypothetical protein|nr:DUF1302 domain-containing protein [Stenotrophobium sp.]
MAKILQAAVLGGLCLACGSAYALDYQWGDFGFTWKNRVSAGAAFRMQKPSGNLIGKLNIPGQQNLCAPDDCISFTGDPAPNQRLVDAAGSFFGGNSDNGEMNYQRYDVVAAASLLDTDFKVTYHDFMVRVRGFGFFDPVNNHFKEHHNNTLYQPAETRRSNDANRRIGKNFELMDAYGQYSFDAFDHHAVLSVGQQGIRWGESTLVAVNSIAEINPPSQANLYMPGIQFNELFLPVPSALLSVDVASGLTVDLMYQFGWRPVQFAAAGSFLSSSDIIGGGNYVTIGLGQFPEDPDGKLKPAGVLGLISSTSFTAHMLPDDYGDPKNGGQYGAKVTYSADWLNGGTELGFYYLNYHSRLPYLSVFAANKSCARDSANAAQAAIDCKGFNGTLNVAGLGLEPAPIDTIKPFFDYPEDIHMFGISFNTNVGTWSLAGEVSYRPNLPLQIQYSDVIFASIQPALPRKEQDLPLGVVNISLPSSREAAPDYLSVYRNTEIQPNQLIRGYQRFKVGQYDFTGIKAFSSNPFGADQIIWIAEVGATQVFNLPSLDRLQIEGNSPLDTHHSPGADGTGQPNGQPDTHTFNPTQQNDGFATRFAWGLRSIVQMEYDNVMFGWNLKPQFIFSHDMTGIAPFPNQNFVQGTSQVIAGTDINVTQNLSGHVQYQWYFGGGRNNALIDRDNAAISVSYSF